MKSDILDSTMDFIDVRKHAATGLEVLLTTLPGASKTRLSGGGRGGVESVGHDFKVKSGRRGMTVGGWVKVLR